MLGQAAIGATFGGIARAVQEAQKLARAQAFVDYQIARSERLAAEAEALATQTPTAANVRAADVAAAHVIYSEEYATAFLAYVGAVSAADADRAAAQNAAGSAEFIALADADIAYTEQVSDADAAWWTGLTTVDLAYASQNRAARDSYGIDRAQAQADHVNTTISAQAQRGSSVALAEATYHNLLAVSGTGNRSAVESQIAAYGATQAATQQTADTTWTTDIASAGRTYTRAIVTADTLEAKAQATHDLAYDIALSNADLARSTARRAAADVRTTADIAAIQQFQIDLAEADADFRSGRLEAQSAAWDELFDRQALPTVEFGRDKAAVQLEAWNTVKSQYIAMRTSIAAADALFAQTDAALLSAYSAVEDQANQQFEIAAATARKNMEYAAADQTEVAGFAQADLDRDYLITPETTPGGASTTYVADVENLRDTLRTGLTATAVAYAEDLGDALVAQNTVLAPAWTTLQNGQLQAAVTRQLAVTTAEMDSAVAFSEAVAEATESTSFSTATPWHAEYTAVTEAEATLKSGLAQASETWATAALAAHQAYGQALTTAKVAVRAQQLADVAEKLVEDAQNPSASGGTGGSGYPGTPPEEDVIVPPTRETADPTGWGAPSAPNVDRYTDAQGSGMTGSFDIGANPIAATGGMPGSTTSFFNTTAQSNLEHHTRGESYSFLDPFGPLFRTVDQATFGGDGSAPNGWLLPSGGSMQYYAGLEGEGLLPLDVDDGAEQRKQLNKEGSVGGGTGDSEGGTDPGQEAVSNRQEEIQKLRRERMLKILGITQKLMGDANSWAVTGLFLVNPLAGVAGEQLLLEEKDRGQFLKGFWDGFIYDGLGGSVTGIWDMVQGAGQAVATGVRLGTAADPVWGSIRRFFGDDFAYEKKVVTDTVETVQNVAARAQVLMQKVQAAGTQFVEDLFSGDPARLAKYGEELQLVGELAQDMLVGLADEIANMSMYDRGKLVGFILYQVVEEVALEFAGQQAISAANKVRLGCTIANKLRKATAFQSPMMREALERMIKAASNFLEMCFVAGTLVHTSEGPRPIEQIRTGDQVLAWNDGHIGPQTFEDGMSSAGITTAPLTEPQFRKVLATVTTHPQVLLRLTFRTADATEEIVCTTTHPFHVAGRGFLSASALSVGDRVTLLNRSTAVLIHTEVNHSEKQPFTTYNLCVDEDHTYFVGEAGIWVHNTGGDCTAPRKAFFEAVEQGKSVGAARNAATKAWLESGGATTELQELLRRLELDYETGSLGLPGSPEHKALRWKEYQERGGQWDYDRWSNVYDENMVRAKRANKVADDYHRKLGWGRREVTVRINGVPRKLDIADVVSRRAVEVKSGYTTLTVEVSYELARDAALRKKGWDVRWHFDGVASQPLLNELNRLGIPYTGGQ